MPKDALNHDLSNLVRPLKLTPGFIAFVAVYVAILLWFKYVDIYHQEFSTAGLQVAVYNLCRILYIFYLFWIVYQAGNFLLTRVAKEAW